MGGRGETTPESLARAVLARDLRALARALTVVENDADEGAALLDALRVGRAPAHRVGVTGPPGVGKSTLLGRLAVSWRGLGRRVGVLAVDPTSPFRGGALLGDRVRLGDLAGDPDVFVRSLATRGAFGGLSAATEDLADVLEAAGFDPVLIETVGVGQAEVEIARAADTTVLVLAPGGGDEVQAMKAGLLEAADLIVVNQADREGAERMVNTLRSGLGLADREPPPVLLTVATTGEGVAALLEAIDRRVLGAEAADLRPRRLSRARHRIRAAVDRARAERFWGHGDVALDRWAERVLSGDVTPRGAARSLLEEEGR